MNDPSQYSQPEQDSDATRRASPPELPNLPEPMSDETRAAADSGTRLMPPVAAPPQPQRTIPPPIPPGRLPQPPRAAQTNQMPRVAQPYTQVPRTSRERRSPDQRFSLPLWSIALTIFLALACAGSIIGTLIALGGNTAPDKAPVVIVSSPLATIANLTPIPQPTATTAPINNPTPAQTPLSFALSGPTLSITEPTPTPRTIVVGVTVQVIDVGVDQLNVRDGAGVFDTSIIFRADEGATFSVIEGPTQADGLTWWRIQDPFNSTRTGWAAANYLQVTP